MSQQTLLDEAATSPAPLSASTDVKLNIRSLKLDDDALMRFFNDNPEWRFEITAEGELVIMPPTGMETGWRNSTLNYYFVQWAKSDGTGMCFDSSTMFTLPNGAKRSPDVSWIRHDRVEALTKKQQESFAPICPDFVLELRSPSDTVRAIQAKMQEYMDNGAQLGWLIDPQAKRVYVYRPNQSVEALDDPETVSGDAVLPGFTLHVREIW